MVYLKLLLITLNYYVQQTSADSTVRVLSLSRYCPDFPENRVRCLSAVLILCKNSLSDFCLDIIGILPG